MTDMLCGIHGALVVFAWTLAYLLSLCLTLLPVRGWGEQVNVRPPVTMNLFK